MYMDILFLSKLQKVYNSEAIQDTLFRTHNYNISERPIFVYQIASEHYWWNTAVEQNCPKNNLMNEKNKRKGSNKIILIKCPKIDTNFQMIYILMIFS